VEMPNCEKRAGGRRSLAMPHYACAAKVKVLSWRVCVCKRKAAPPPPLAAAIGNWCQAKEKPP